MEDINNINDINIRHFKLTNGEDLICYVQDTNTDAFIVERPAAVQVSPAGQWTFQDWFPFSDKKVFKIMKRFVINHTEVVEETKESYIKYSLQYEIKQLTGPEFELSDDYTEDDELNQTPLNTDEKEPTIH